VYYTEFMDISTELLATCIGICSFLFLFVQNCSLVKCRQQADAMRVCDNVFLKLKVDHA
jgi:hypothetical protein